MEESTSLGDFIAKKRHQLGLSLRGMAAKSGIDDSLLSKIERGQVRQPTPENLDRLARAINVDPEDLYSLAGYAAATRLPTIGPYLRTKYGLPSEAVDELTSYFEFVRGKHSDDTTNKT
jgi:transcriptional regulator with XRE-family HTH domain